MIRLILGLPGSGKTLTAVRQVVKQKGMVYTNFHVRHPEVKRIKMNYVLEYDDKDKPVGVNWDYWRKAVKDHGGFHIYIDELHNVMHSRMSMSKRNILMSQWVAQIRKVTGENERYDFVCVSQALERVDVAVRDLTYELITCKKIQCKRLVDSVVYESGKKKIKKVRETWIILTRFTGDNAVNRYTQWRDNKLKTYNDRSAFKANNFFRYYESYALVDFGHGEYL